MSYTADHVNATVEFEKFESAITETVERTPYDIEYAIYKDQPQQTATVSFDDTTSATETETTDANFAFSTEIVAYKVKLTITNNSNVNINIHTTAQEPNEQDNWFIKIIPGEGCDSLARTYSANMFVYVGIKDLTKNVNTTNFNIQTALEKVSFVELSYKVNNQIVETQQVQKNTSATLLNAYYKDFEEDIENGNYGQDNKLQRTYGGEKQGVGAWLDAQGNIVDKDTVITQNTILEPDWYFYDNSTSAWTMTSNAIAPTSTTKQKAKIIIPNEVDGKDVTSIGDYAFNNCSALTQITIPSSVTSIGDYAFGTCYALTGIIIPSSVINISEGAFIACIALETVEFETDSLLGSIGRVVFADCYALTEITIPSSVTSIDSGAFGGCYALTGIIIPSSVINISEGAFADCSALQTVTFGAGSLLDSIGEMAFYFCEALTQISIPSSVTSIDSGAFGGCISLQSISVEAGNGHYYSDGRALFDLNKTTIFTYAVASGTSYTIPSSVTSIDYGSFVGCFALQSIYVEEGNQNYYSDGRGLFKKTSPTTAIIIAYANASGTSYTIPSSVTSIGYYAFTYCISLAEITIPSSVTSIGDYAFVYCGSLIRVNILRTSEMGAVATLTQNATALFYQTPANIYVPNQATKDALMGNQYWNTLGGSRIIVDESLLAM